MSESHQLLTTSLSLAGNTFGWILAGLAARRLGVLPLSLVNRISRISFNTILPLLLFSGATQLDIGQRDNFTYLWAGAIATLLNVVLVWQYAKWRGIPRAYQGIFVQGAYRANLAIIGISLCTSAYGEKGLVLASLAIALWTTLFNILAVIVLSRTLEEHQSPLSTMAGILRNPLIIAIAAGTALALSPLQSPPVVITAGKFISAYFLPLILLCIGAAMDLSALRNSGALVWQATFWRLVIAPAICLTCALLMGVQGMELGVLFLLMAAPVAAASFVMVVAARGDGACAANILMLSTLLSAISVPAGFALLTWLSL